MCKKKNNTQKIFGLLQQQQQNPIDPPPLKCPSQHGAFKAGCPGTVKMFCLPCDRGFICAPWMERHSREREKGAEQWHKRSPGGLFPANENLLCLSLRPVTRAAEFQIAALNFAQLSHAWLSPIWVLILPFSLLLLVFCLFYFFSLSFPAALPVSLWIYVLVFSPSHFRCFALTSRKRKMLTCELH